MGRVRCRVCRVSYAKALNRLEEGIDVYARWIDACDEANTTSARPESSKQSANVHTSRTARDADDDEFLSSLIY